jgi:hypothetical protein
MLTVLVFSGHESLRLWTYIYLPGILWLISLACLRFPISGSATYLSVLVFAILLCVDPANGKIEAAVFHQCCDNLRYAIFAVALLIVNALVSRTPLRTERLEH